MRRLVVHSQATHTSVVVADPAATRAIAQACAEAQGCDWAGEGPYRLEFRLTGGRAVWFGYDPAGPGYLASLASGRPRAWRPSVALRLALAPYLPR